MKNEVKRVVNSFHVYMLLDEFVKKTKLLRDMNRGIRARKKHCITRAVL